MAQLVATAIEAEFKVEQNSASGFGYIVRSNAEGETADIRAFEALVPDEGESRIMLDLAGSGFRREVVPVGAHNALMALLHALASIAAFGVRKTARLRNGPIRWSESDAERHSRRKSMKIGTLTESFACENRVAMAP